MSSLTLLNSLKIMPFLILTTIFLFIDPMLIIRIATMWSNLKQKISDELSAHVTKIINDLNIKNNTSEIKNIFSKLIMKINTKITNELFTHLSEVNSTFTVKLSKNNNKLITEINKINSYDAEYASKMQKILLMINNVTTRLENIKKACYNDFGNISSEFTSIKIFIKAL